MFREMSAAGIIEVLGIPMLFLEQNSPIFILVMFAAVILVIAMMFAYIKIEAEYKKQIKLFLYL